MKAGKIIFTKNFIWFLFASILFFIISQQYVFPLQNFDSSWAHALVNATAQRYNFADKFIYTYGPAWFFLHHFYDSRLYFLFILSSIFTSVVFGICIANSGKKLFTLLFIIWAYLMAPNEEFWPLFLIVLMYQVAISPNLSFQKIIILFWLGFIAYSKFTYFILTGPLFLLIDLHNIAKKNYRFPLFSTVYLGCLLCAYIILGQNILTFFTFFSNSIEVSSGYSKALGFPLNMLNLTQAYIVIGLFLLFGVSSVALIFRSNNVLGSKISKSIVILWALFAIFKMGYVRADAHIYSTQIVFILLMIYILILSIRLNFYSILCSACLVITCLILLPHENIFSLKFPLNRIHGITFNKNILDHTYEVVKNTVVTTKIPIPGNAAVDSYPNDVSELILGGYNYYPRPVCQCCVSCTPSLQNLDDTHLAQNKTDYVIIKPDIDYPTFIYGKSLITILKNYDIDNYCYLGIDKIPSAILKRRKNPKEKIIVDSFNIEISVGKWQVLPPQNADFREVRIDFRPTLIGDIKNFLLHQDIAWLEVKTEADTVCKFRFIPNIASNGFLLSPLLYTTGDMVWYKNAGKIKKIKIYSDNSFMFKDIIYIKAIDFNLTGKPENIPACDSSELFHVLARRVNPQ